GDRIYRHKPKEGPPEFAAGPTPYLPQIEHHIRRWIGPAPMVFHELLSPEAHIDLPVVPRPGSAPPEDRPLGSSYYTVVTSGMSSRPMNAPEGAEELRYAELM